MPGDEFLADVRALAQFRYQVRRYLTFSAQAVREAGLEPRQYQLILSVKGLASERGASVGQIAEWLQIQHHSAVELVDRAVERGLVTRRQDDQDRRRVLVVLTPRGDDLLDHLVLVHRAEMLSAAPALVQSLAGIMPPVQTAESDAASDTGIVAERVGFEPTKAF